MALADILVTIDGSEETGAALAEGAALARDHEATLHLLVVPEGERRARAAAAGAAREVVEAALAAVDTAGVEVEPFVVTHGNVASAVRGYAVAHGVDLVVTGTGEGPDLPADRRVRDLHGDEDLAVLSV